MEIKFDTVQKYHSGYSMLKKKEKKLDNSRVSRTGDKNFNA